MDPNSFVKQYLDFANARPGDNVVLFSMVTLQSAGGDEPNQRPSIASYAEGYLTSDGNGGIAGRVGQFFSDRRQPGSRVLAPFDENRTDDLGVEIAVAQEDFPITLVAHSWGGGRQTLTDVHQDGEVLVGVGSSIGNQTKEALYVISLGQSVTPG
jgi:hypothetical protein